MTSAQASRQYCKLLRGSLAPSIATPTLNMCRRSKLPCSYRNNLPDCTVLYCTYSTNDVTTLLCVSSILQVLGAICMSLPCQMSVPGPFGRMIEISCWLLPWQVNNHSWSRHDRSSRLRAFSATLPLPRRVPDSNRTGKIANGRYLHVFMYSSRFRQTGFDVLYTYLLFS